jgi:two-component system sensor histidine kinase BaeS
MKLKFSHKVFLAFLLNSLIIVASILLIGRYFSERHFQEYVVTAEAAAATKLVEALSQEYRKRGNWDAVLEEPGLWFDLRAFGPVMLSGQSPPQEHASLHAGERDAGVLWMGPGWQAQPPTGVPIPPPGPLRMPPPGQGPPALNQPPPPPHLGAWGAGAPGSGPGPQSQPPNEAQVTIGPGPRPVHPHDPPIALFDAEKNPLTPLGDSSSQDSYRLSPIDADGRLVGWLGLRKFERPTHHLEFEFIRRQSQTFYTIGSVALILAVLVTFFLSRHLLAPVKELEKGTRALISRRFDTRIVVKSRDELGQLAAGFNEMTMALERHQQTQQQWLVDISHELRTPLAILRGEIEAMQDGVRTFTRQGLDSLHQEVLHLGRIVSDLHDLSLIESRGFGSELTVVNPRQILMETLDCFRTRLDLRGIRLDIEEAEQGDILVPADADRVKQLFSNLIENTLRYVNVPGVVKVTFQAGPDELLVSFEDSGPGVPEESLAFLFDRLYRVDRARSREHGGSGLGLAICKGIMESFSGKIEASNSSGGGLKICMTFPRPAGSGAMKRV